MSSGGRFVIIEKLWSGANILGELWVLRGGLLREGRHAREGAAHGRCSVSVRVFIGCTKSRNDSANLRLWSTLSFAPLDSEKSVPTSCGSEEAPLNSWSLDP